MANVKENGKMTQLTAKKPKTTSKKTEISAKMPTQKEILEPEIEVIEMDAASQEEWVDAEIEANKKIFDEFFNLDYAKSLAKNVLTPIEKFYFRAEFIGFDKDSLPERNNPKRPLIYAGNHSGMAFPWDGIIFASGLMRLNGYDLKKSCRGLSSPMLSKTKLMNPFLIPNFWKRAGGIDATTLNFDTLMHYNEANILIYPEGVEGIGKGFDKKYQLQRLSTSSLRMSIKYKTDIIPFATVNAEYINPFSYSFKAINDLVQKIGIPFLPIGPTTLLVLLQPWMFYFGFPAKLIFVRGRRIKPYEYINKPFEEITREELEELRDFIHSQMQLELHEAVREYGQKPFDLQEFFNTLVQNWRKIPFFLPVFWPLIFIEHERRFAELQEKLAAYSGDTTEEIAKREEIIEEAMDAPEEDLFSMIKSAANIVVKNPQVLLFYVPVFGLVPTLLKGYSKD